MSDSCRCFDVRAKVVMDEPKLSGKLDFSGEIITCSDGEDYKRGYEEGHAQGLLDGAKEEQEKSVTITKNGTTEILPDENKVLSKVTVDVNVADRWYNILWDNFQLNGERDNYNCAFYDYCTPNCWNSSILYPKYDIKGTNFANCFRDVKGELDLIERLKETNVTLDTSQATSFGSMFRGCSGLTTVPTIDFSSCDITLTGASAGAYHMFSGCSRLHTIEKIVSKEGITYTNTFQNCSALREVRFEGVINQSISFANSPLLTIETVDSVSVHLDDLTEQTAQTLTVHKDVFERMSDEQKAFVTSKNWTLVSSK